MDAYLQRAMKVGILHRLIIGEKGASAIVSFAEALVPLGAHLAIIDDNVSRFGLGCSKGCTVVMRRQHLSAMFKYAWAAMTEHDLYSWGVAYSANPWQTAAVRRAQATRRYPPDVLGRRSGTVMSPGHVSVVR